MEIERRKFPRLAASVLIDYSVLGDVAASPSPTKNVSAGGICIIVYSEVKVGARLALKIDFPGESRPVVAIGQIIWKEEFSISTDPKKRFEVGVEFIDIDEADREKVSRYILQIGTIKP